MYARRSKHTSLYSEHLLTGIIHFYEGNSTTNQYSTHLPTLTTTNLYKTAQELFPSNIEIDADQENNFSLEIRDILYNSDKERVTRGAEFITPEALLLATLSPTSNRATQILQTLQVDISLLKDMLYKELKHEEESSRKHTLTPTNLQDLTRNLCALAKEGKIDPVFGRSKELLRLTQVLTRRTKSNPILIGEPGVGKTALIEGLAYQLVHDPKSLPEEIRNKTILQLDVGAIVAGTSERGALEKRLTDLIKTLKQNKQIILFVDEIHTLVAGSGKTTKRGSEEDGFTISNILKPPLARGEISCIGSTTFTEYVKYFQKDPAFDRRFQPIFVEEPSPQDALTILLGLKASYEAYHECSYEPEAIQAAIDLSVRYLPDRKLPDKAIDLLDEAGSLAKMKRLYRVTPQMIEQTLTTWTTIPVSFSDDNLEQLLKKEIIGQDDAITSVVQAIKRNKTNMRDPKKPIASFLFAGPTGVGKTQLAKLLAANTPNSSLIRLDMSEYMESHTISSLLGAPPGYAGYEDPGKLTEAVKRKPYSIVLFDEIEKAHPSIWNILLQVLEDGTLSDSKKKKVSFKNTIIILTCNEMPKFRPELLNRFDEIITFQSLDKEAIQTITDKQLHETLTRIKDVTNASVTVKEETRNKIITEGMAGPREIRRAIAKYIEDAVADILLQTDKKYITV
jgi:ATP-dependent Clp protease ATP-binding subunit ClpC